jgi:hypothetical protein
MALKDSRTNNSTKGKKGLLNQLPPAKAKKGNVEILIPIAKAGGN